MKELIRLLEEMLQRKVILDYVIGGATALIYYCEPFQTQDIDVFVIIEQDADIISLSEIYEFLKKHGGEVRGEYVLIHGIPVQFLVPYNSLVDEAVQNGVKVSFDDLGVKIMALEYLMAIMVQTGRGKDKVRLENIESLPIDYDSDKFQRLLKKHKLESKWCKIKEGFGQ